MNKVDSILLTEQRNLDGRQNYIDWLRSLAFILLIFYHIGMYYVADWGWHIKSEQPYEWLQYLMLLVNQWRMPLIFLVSGMVLGIVEIKVSAASLLRMRFIRLFIPLVFGMYFIVPPQVYYEAVEQFSYAGSYWSFWLEYINPTSTVLPKMHQSTLGMLTWNHLWYLAYLCFYTVAYVIIRPLLIKTTEGFKSRSLSLWLIVLAPIIVMTICGLTLKPAFPKTHALFDDWYNHSIYFLIFMIGYALAKSNSSLNLICKYRKTWLATALTGYIGIAALHSINRDLSNWAVLIEFWVYANMWSWLLAILGFAITRLNKPSLALSYLNEAVLPWYILHQTVIITIAVLVKPWPIKGVFEFALITLGTFIVCASLYELIRRLKPIRFLFGMKTVTTNKP